MVQFFQDFMLTRSIPDGINDTAIVIIPKKKNPKNMRDLQLIASCNVSYRVPQRS